MNGILAGKGVVRIDGHLLSERTIRAIRGKVGLVFHDPDDQLFSPTVLLVRGRFRCPLGGAQGMP